MPDWSYRTILRPLMLALGPERARRLAVTSLATLARAPFGLAAIDFLGHMRPDEHLRTTVGEIDLPSPVLLGSMIDPGGEALRAFGRFGVGLVEVGPVAMQANEVPPDWRIDLDAGCITSSSESVASLETLERSLARAVPAIPVCVRIAEKDPAAIQHIVRRLVNRAAIFSVDADDPAQAKERISAARGDRPVVLSIAAGTEGLLEICDAAMTAGADGVWLRGGAGPDEARVRSLRATVLPPGKVLIAGGVREPDEVRRLLEAGADAAVVDAGLVSSGPGLVKRCNEALASARLPATEPEPLTIEAARRSWFWGLLLGASMFAGGVMAAIIGATGIVLPYDESLSGLTRQQLAALNPRLLAFMAHDRISLAGTMFSIGIFYMALAWDGIRRGAHWAQVTLIVSATAGFISFFFFLGFGYFDPFHAFVTALLTQFTVMCLVLPPSPRAPLLPEWRESARWRRGQWGQLIFILIGLGLTGAGLVISYIGCTTVFVETDLHFMRTSASELSELHHHLVPLVAHDRATLGGMLIANGVVVWLSAQWGFRAGARWLWLALAAGGNIAFASTIAVHFAVGYSAFLHLVPAFLGWAGWNLALGLTHGWLARAVDPVAPSVPLVT